MPPISGFGCSFSYFFSLHFQTCRLHTISTQISDLYSNKVIILVARYSNPLYRPGQTLKFPVGWGYQALNQSAHEGGKSVTPTHRPPSSPVNILGTHFYYRLTQPKGPSGAARIMWTKNSNYFIRDRTLDIPVCSSVRQTAAWPILVVKLLLTLGISCI